MPDAVTVELPQALFDKLQALAEAEQTDPVTVMARLVALAHQRQSWRRDLEALRQEIRRGGGLALGTTREEVVNHLRQTRRDLFEAEYAHLYR